MVSNEIYIYYYTGNDTIKINIQHRKAIHLLLEKDLESGIMPYNCITLEIVLL